MFFQHRELASARWHKMTLAEQLGNVGSEVGRILRSREKDPKAAQSAFDRALELLDLTLQDPRWRNFPGRLKEIARAREFLCDAFFGEALYGTSGTSLDDLDKYFFNFALAARQQK